MYTNKKKLDIIMRWICRISIIATASALLYGVANYITFLNIIEAPLPEHKEKIPNFNSTEE